MIASARIAAETHLPRTGSRRTASSALMPLAEAVPLLTGHLAPVPIRTLSPTDAVGHVAGSDILAERNEPARATALHDGWAIRADDILGASPYAPVLLTRPLTWVDAGSAMPEGTDAVLPPEAAEGRSVVGDVPAGAGRRASGEEIGAGTRLIAAGTRIGPRHRVVLEAAGITFVPVRVPRLGLVVASGLERDTLSPLIAAMVLAEGARVTEVVRVAGPPEAIAEAIQATEADATLVLGGTGVGRNDHGAAGLARAGSLQAHGVALRPGETAGFGEAGGRPVLLLPGRPDAALAAFITLGRPLVAALSGAQPSVVAQAPLLRKITSTIGLSEIVFARLDAAGLMPLGGADLPLRSLIEADAAILVAPEAEGHPAGTSVAVLPL